MQELNLKCTYKYLGINNGDGIQRIKLKERFGKELNLSEVINTQVDLPIVHHGVNAIN